MIKLNFKFRVYYIYNNKIIINFISYYEAPSILWSKKKKSEKEKLT